MKGNKTQHEILAIIDDLYVTIIEIMSENGDTNKVLAEIYKSKNKILGRSYG
jgi:hypothetical protein